MPSLIQILACFIWTNPRMLLIGPMGTNISEILLKPKLLLKTKVFLNCRLPMSQGIKRDLSDLRSVVASNLKLRTEPQRSSRWRPGHSSCGPSHFCDDTSRYLTIRPSRNIRLHDKVAMETICCRTGRSFYSTVIIDYMNAVIIDDLNYISPLQSGEDIWRYKEKNGTFCKHSDIFSQENLSENVVCNIFCMP